MDFSTSHDIGPRWIIVLAGVGIVAAFAAGLLNSVVYYETLPKDANAEILVFYQPTCPHCIAEIPTIKELVRAGYTVSAFNVFKHPQLAREYGITATPTIVLTKTGQKLQGEQSYTEIIAAIKGSAKLWGNNGAACGVNKVSTCSRT